MDEKQKTFDQHFITSKIMEFRCCVKVSHNSWLVRLYLSVWHKFKTNRKKRYKMKRKIIIPEENNCEYNNKQKINSSMTYI